MSKLRLVLRAVLDCAYLVRSRLSRRNRRRIFIEYVWLTLKVLARRSPDTPGLERVLGYSVRHFGLGSLQFLFREIFVRNEYFFKATTDRPRVLDCGANIGLATLFFKWVYPQCEIHAFEPDPETFQVLSENVHRNGLTDVHLHNVALADKPGPLDFYVPRDSMGSPLMSIVSDRVAGARRILVTASPLSRHVDGREVDFLKLDVEGAEDGVMRDLVNTGALRNIREMAVEYHHNLHGATGSCGSFLQLLHDNGFEYQLDATWGGGGALGDFQDILVRARRVIPGKGRRANGASFPTSITA